MTLDTSNENQLVDKFFAEHKEIVAGMVERAVNKRVAEILEEQHEKVMETMNNKVLLCVWKVMEKEVDGIRIAATEEVSAQWRFRQSFIDGTFTALRERIKRLEDDDNSADWWKRERDEP